MPDVVYPVALCAVVRSRNLIDCLIDCNLMKDQSILVHNFRHSEVM